MISLVCVPMMLIPKPLIIWIQSLKNQPSKPYHAPEANHQSDNSQQDLNEEFLKEEEMEEKEHRRSSSRASTHKGDHDDHDIS